MKNTFKAAKEAYTKYETPLKFSLDKDLNFQKKINSAQASKLINKNGYNHYCLSGLEFFKMFFENVDTNQIFEWYLGTRGHAYIITKL